MSHKNHSIRDNASKVYADYRAEVASYIKANPTEPHEQVAVRFGCSYPFVNKVAREAGLSKRSSKGRAA